jgi:hypothetical protein
MRQYAAFLTHVKNDAQLAQTYLNIAEEIENEEMRDHKGGMIDDDDDCNEQEENIDFESVRRPAINVEEVKDTSESQDITVNKESTSDSSLQFQMSTELGKSDSRSGSRSSFKQVAVHDPKDGSITIYPPKTGKSEIKPEKKQKIDMWRQQVSFPSDQAEPIAKETKKEREVDSDSDGEEVDKSHTLTEDRKQLNDSDSETYVTKRGPNSTIKTCIAVMSRTVAGSVLVLAVNLLGEFKHEQMLSSFNKKTITTKHEILSIF